MGWTSFQDFAGMTPDWIIRRELNGTNENGANWEIVDSATKLGEWYGICKFTAPGQDPIHYGMVVLYKRSKKTGEFSYKDMTETCGPGASRAPVRLIDALDRLAPIPADDARQSAQWALAWRQRCRNNVKRKPKLKLAPGQIVTFPNVTGQFELIMPIGPRRGWSVRYVGGSMSYTASARQIAQCKVLDPAQFMREHFQIVHIG
jgi:hypothetical protein